MQMHWLTVTLLLSLVFLVLILVVVFALMMRNSPSEADILAGDPDLAHLRTGDRAHRVSAHDNNPLVSRMMPRFDLGSVEVPEETEDTPADPNRAIQLLNAIVSTTGECTADPGTGDGIVICAGGFVYGTCATILLNVLRSSGCELPIEIWHRNDEVSAELQALWMSFGNITVRNIDQVSSIAFANSFAIKPLAVFHSTFQRVLLLDADNISVRDPTYLFDQLNATTSAVFWPHYWPLSSNATCWQALSQAQRERINYNTTQDSGQLLIDKSRAMRAVNLCCKINIQLSSYLERLFFEPSQKSDGDTWHFSCLATDTPFQMQQHRAGVAGTRDQAGLFIGTTVVQFDASAQPVFLHKCWAKWATQTQMPQWTDVLRFVNKRGTVNRWTHDLEDAPVSKDMFVDLFGDLEERCWIQLKALRSLTWYQTQYAAELQGLTS